MKSISQLMSLKGRTALITGGGGYIGSAVGHALAEAGCAVAAIDISKQSAQKAADAIAREHEVKTLAIEADLADEDQVRALPQAVADKLGSLDILVNCAAFVGTTNLEGWVVPFAEQTSEAWRMAVEVNLTSAFVLIQAATPYLEKSGHGSVVNVGSIYGVAAPDMRLYEGTAMGNPAAYAASKGGLMQLTKWLSTVLAPKVRVNAISPGGVWRNQPKKFVSRYEERTPLGRMATEEDMVGAALYLASDLSAYVTGQNIMIDGGWTAW